jgi:hypothetical protein
MREKATKGISLRQPGKDAIDHSFPILQMAKERGGERCGQKDLFAKNKLKTLVL